MMRDKLAFLAIDIRFFIPGYSKECVEVYFTVASGSIVWNIKHSENLCENKRREALLRKIYKVEHLRNLTCRLGTIRQVLDVTTMKLCL